MNDDVSASMGLAALMNDAPPDETVLKSDWQTTVVGPTSHDEPHFAFGRNWQQFLATIDELRIEQAVQSLKKLMRIDSLAGQSFLDAGCGSGLFSLAAYRLGAKVTSIRSALRVPACSANDSRTIGRDGRLPQDR